MSSVRESVLILVFGCAPLLLLLIAALVLRARVTPRSYVKLPTFSLAISRFGRTEVTVIYRNETRNLYFDARVGGRMFRKCRIAVSAPSDLSPEDFQAVVPKLAEGLSRLRYEYLIFRKTNPRPIPEEERQAAITELRQMGFEIQVPAGPGQIGRAVTHSWKRTSGEQAKARISQVQSLMVTASGVLEDTEVLARSD